MCIHDFSFEKMCATTFFGLKKCASMSRFREQDWLTDSTEYFEKTYLLRVR
jgi:hypothetical protein